MNRLREIRESEGLAITELSRLSGVSEKTIRYIENGERAQNYLREDLFGIIFRNIGVLGVSINGNPVKILNQQPALNAIALTGISREFENLNQNKIFIERGFSIWISRCR